MASRTPARQDFIARTRYKNVLPPPPCRAKLIDIKLDLDQYTTPEFLSGMVQKMRQPLSMEIDRELGMPIDLTELGPQVFEPDSETSEMVGKSGQVKLDPKDQELLADPDSITSGHVRAIKNPEVAFLRRTEYISNEAIKQARMTSAADDRLAHLVEQPGLQEDPVKQVELIEKSFFTTTPMDDLDNYRHPIKKDLKPVEAWDFIPELQLLDLNYLLVKLTGSAPGQQSQVNNDPRLQTAIYRPTTTEYGDDYVSYYLASEEDSRRVKRRLVSSDKSNNEETYLFRHVRDYDMELRQYSGSMDEIAVTFNNEAKRATFVPIMGRTNLKRRRVLSINKQAVNEARIDAIDLSIRDLSSEEMNDRNSVRHTFDPLDYPV